MNARTRNAARAFSALGDPTRLHLLQRLLKRGPQSTRTLTASTKVTRQAVTVHLTILNAVGLVTSERVGRERVWTASPQMADHLWKWWAQA